MNTRKDEDDQFLSLYHFYEYLIAPMITSNAKPATEIELESEICGNWLLSLM